MKILDQKLDRLGNRLYEKFGKPLEKKHWGEYIAISKTGKTVLGDDLIRVMKKSLVSLGQGSFIFKVGEKAVYKWRKVKL